MTNIADTLVQHAVAIELLEPHPDNARLGDVELIKESLQRFGQVRPILVQSSTGYVVAGNHTMKAARELGWEKIAAIGVEMDDDEALAYLIADNRLGDLAGYDDPLLAKVLEKLTLQGRLAGTGWTPDQFDDLMSSMDALPVVEPAPFEGANTEHAERRGEGNTGATLRQFVLMYEMPAPASEVEQLLRRLQKAWGMNGAAPVVLEALRRTSADPPIEALTPEEAELANAPDEFEPTPNGEVIVEGPGGTPVRDEEAEEAER